MANTVSRQLLVALGGWKSLSLILLRADDQMFNQSITFITCSYNQADNSLMLFLKSYISLLQNTQALTRGKTKLLISRIDDGVYLLLTYLSLTIVRKNLLRCRVEKLGQEYISRQSGGWERKL